MRPQTSLYRERNKIIIICGISGEDFDDLGNYPEIEMG